MVDIGKCKHLKYKEKYDDITQKTKHTCKACGAFRYVSEDGTYYKWINRVNSIELDEIK